MIRDIERIFTKYVHTKVGSEPHQAQSSDTDLDIRRHDPDQLGKRKDHEKEDEASLFDEEDRAALSIVALMSFLKQFLDSLPQEETEQEQGRVQSPDTGKATSHISQRMNSEVKRPASAQAKQAYAAYNTASQTSSPSKLSDEDTRKTAHNMGLDTEEIRVIHRLLDDLQALKHRGHAYLAIERSDTFLHSLSNAAQKALSQTE